jgi:hypothetical protein
MRLPEIWAKCESCDSECAGHPPENVAWSYQQERWLCSECWSEYDTDERTIPLVYAKDALLGTEEQMQQLIAAATKQRLGVK